MKNLKTYKEFKDKNCKETSDYEIPDSAVKPPPNDKVWNYVKDEIKNSPIWGFKLKKQEKINPIISDR